MSISAEQATEATIFLTLYREAIEALKFCHLNIDNPQSGIQTMNSSKASQTE